MESLGIVQMLKFGFGSSRFIIRAMEFATLILNTVIRWTRCVEVSTEGSSIPQIADCECHQVCCTHIFQRQHYIFLFNSFTS